jgi:hypothetical protein
MLEGASKQLLARILIVPDWLLQEGLLLNLIGLLRTGRAGKHQLQGYLYSILDCSGPPKQG